MKSETLWIIGVFIVIISGIMLNIDAIWYPNIVGETYQVCESTCIKENGTSPCDCQEITDKESTTPLAYSIIFILIMVIGLIMMLRGFLKEK